MTRKTDLEPSSGNQATTIKDTMWMMRGMVSEKCAGQTEVFTKDTGSTECSKELDS